MKNNETNIFRLAATLYRDKGLTTRRHKTVLKIIESIFLELSNEFMSVDSLILNCDLLYSISLIEEEVKVAIQRGRNCFEEVVSQNGFGKLYRLTERHYDSLQEKIKPLLIESHIDAYLLEKFGVVDNDEKNKIFGFLHSTFTTSLQNYRIFLDAVEQKTSDTPSYLTNIKDIELINGFLSFDNENKNKAIFNIVNLSLEYCLLISNKVHVSARHINQKHFYLDSNMIYRAIGINGHDRKVLTEKFLENCVDSGIRFSLLETTFVEFKDSVIYKINNIYKYKHRRIAFDVFQKYSSDDFYEFYYSWANKKTNPDKDLFLAHIFSLFNEIKRKYRIDVDRMDYLIRTPERVVNELAEDIKSRKAKFDRHITDQIVLTDAKMVLSLREKRVRENDSDKSLLSTKHYLISTDQQLRD